MCVGRIGEQALPVSSGSRADLTCIPLGFDSREALRYIKHEGVILCLKSRGSGS